MLNQRRYYLADYRRDLLRVRVVGERHDKLEVLYLRRADFSICFAYQLCDYWRAESTAYSSWKHFYGFPYLDQRPKGTHASPKARPGRMGHPQAQLDLAYISAGGAKSSSLPSPCKTHRTATRSRPKPLAFDSALVTSIVRV